MFGFKNIYLLGLWVTHLGANPLMKQEKTKKVLNFKKSKMAAAHKYSCMIWLHVLIDYRNILTVNLVREQKVVPAGWLLSADRPEISLVQT